MTISMNQAGVLNNRYQQFDKYKRVVTLCSAGCLRSPTAAVVLAQEPYNYNTRCAGLTQEYAITPFTEALYAWADEIVVMEDWMETEVRRLSVEWFGEAHDNQPIITNLGVPDKFAYRQPELIEIIKLSYDSFSNLNDEIPET